MTYPAQRRRHRDYYVGLARRFEREWCGPDQVAWAGRMRRAYTNVRAALDFCLSDPAEHAVGLELAAALHLFWVCCGYIREGRHYLNRVIELDPPPCPALTKVLWVTAWVALAQGDVAGVESLGARCMPYAQEQGDSTAIGWLLHNDATLAIYRGDAAGALVLAERSAELHRHGGDPGIGLFNALIQQCMALAAAGDERAVAVSEELGAECDRYGERWFRAYADYARALSEAGRGDVDAAAAFARDALRFERQVGDMIGMATSLDVLAGTAVATGDAERAARLHGIADRLWRTFGIPQFGGDGGAYVSVHEQGERQARRLLGDEAYVAGFGAGAELDLDAAVAYALDEQPETSIARQPPDWAPLTPRERQVALLVAEGLTNAQIAERLTISRRTADSHVEHILSKLHFTSRVQIATHVTERLVVDDGTQFRDCYR